MLELFIFNHVFIHYTCGGIN